MVHLDPTKTKKKLDMEIKKLSVNAGSLPEKTKVYTAADVKHFEGSKETPKGAFYHAGDLATKTKVIVASKLSKLKKFTSDHEKAIIGSAALGVSAGAALYYNNKAKNLFKKKKKRTFSEVVKGET